jgi:hypothetical protein
MRKSNAEIKRQHGDQGLAQVSIPHRDHRKKETAMTIVEKTHKSLKLSHP